MAKYLMLKHYRGAPESVNAAPMDQWTPQEVDAHVKYMNDFAERLVGTGEYVDSQALSPQGTFVRFDGEGRPPVTDGPFAETKELIAGFWVWQVKSMDEALEWVKRCPNPMPDDSDIEIRPVFEAADFGDALTPELQQQEQRVREQTSGKR
jgi:hypothetical protein